jgi:hypothetical protein
MYWYSLQIKRDYKKKTSTAKRWMTSLLLQQWIAKPELSHPRLVC